MQEQTLSEGGTIDYTGSSNERFTLSYAMDM